MDAELREAVEFAKGVGAESITYETHNAKISIVFRKTVDYGAIPSEYIETTTEEPDDEDLLFYSSGG